MTSEQLTVLALTVLSYVRDSSPVKDLAPALLPVRDDQAIELFYNITVTPWFHLTPDLQVLIPARERTLPPGAESINTAVVLGLRAKIDFRIACGQPGLVLFPALKRGDSLGIQEQLRAENGI